MYANHRFRWRTGRSGAQLPRVDRQLYRRIAHLGVVGLRLLVACIGTNDRECVFRARTGAKVRLVDPGMEAQGTTCSPRLGFMSNQDQPAGARRVHADQAPPFWPGVALADMPHNERGCKMSRRVLNNAVILCKVNPQCYMSLHVLTFRPAAAWDPEAGTSFKAWHEHKLRSRGPPLQGAAPASNQQPWSLPAGQRPGLMSIRNSAARPHPHGGPIRNQACKAGAQQNVAPVDHPCKASRRRLQHHGTSLRGLAPGYPTIRASPPGRASPRCFGL